MKQFGGAVAEARKRAGLSQQELAERIGSSRNAIQNLEAMKGRTSSFNVLDLIEIAAAVGVPPLQLLYPELPDGPVEVLPDIYCTSLQAAQWFSGEVKSDQLPASLPALDTSRTLQARKLQDLREEFELELRFISMTHGDGPWSRQRTEKELQEARAAARADATRKLEEVRNLEEQMRRDGFTVTSTDAEG